MASNAFMRRIFSCSSREYQLAEQIKTKAPIQRLQSIPTFETPINSLLNVGFQNGTFFSTFLSVSYVFKLNSLSVPMGEWAYQTIGQTALVLLKFQNKADDFLTLR